MKNIGLDFCVNTFKDKATSLREKVKEILQNDSLKNNRKLPSECYFLSHDSILAFPRGDGDARYPYAYDGLTLWAYASGNVKMEESIFNIFLPAFEAKEPNLAFWAGIKTKKGYFPVSLLGTARQPIENDVQRYTVFTPQAVYYFTETAKFFTTVRMLVDDEKKLRFSVYVENTSAETVETYVASYMNYFLYQTNAETFESKWYKCGTTTNYGYLISTTEYWGRGNCFEHSASIARSDYDGEIYKTTSKSVFTGSIHNQLNCSTSLINGKFGKDKTYTEFTETAIVGEIIPFVLGKGESFTISYTTAFADSKAEAEKKALENISAEYIDAYVSRQEHADKNRDIKETLPSIIFDDIKTRDIQSESFNFFFENVLRQVEFVSRAKNYAGHLIGIRDIFQQIEASLMWLPDYGRKKIIEALNYIGDDGRAPRQYSYALSDSVLPKMDLRPYIDQGVWIISTVYSYLSFTGDYSILDEVCGYYHFDGYDMDFSARKDTVLEHLLLITQYLLSNLAEDTNCLRILYGDWNDALDGLGTPLDKNKDFGDGVSVMATLQLFQNLNEMQDILQKTGKYIEKIAEYEAYKEKIRFGLEKYAVVENEARERKIVHGWGDKLSYKIGSFCDNDKENRDGLTSNAFWVLSGAIAWDKSLKADILNAYARLDSKYGLKTFEPYFAPSNTAVGRITKLPKGTAENGATYIHATLFGIYSLFEMGEAELAWEQLYKILPLTHDFISTTPFIMSNSYVHNEELGFDGESMSDWFTGSGCVLVKVLIRAIFGVRPNLDGLEIRPALYFPANTRLTMRVKDCNLSIRYENKFVGNRTFIVNGKEKDCIFDEQTGGYKISFTNEELFGAIDILVID